ncbi:hypothetical protein [Proteus mirabilis]|uniref:hypothetical protein n=1 Tax=Proteus mirabilis TaxID=584 RepID=UPI0021001D98|nr:hypothetical protein [Proteus mirabilis]
MAAQLTACFTPKGDCWYYTYDAFGRRLSKTKTVDSDLAHIDPLFPQIKPKITTWRQMQFWRYREGKAENDPNYTECHFRFAGQYEDEESGFIIAFVIMLRRQGSIFLLIR